MAGFDFSQIPSVSIPRSRFPIAKNILTTADPDYVIPIYWTEVLPGDTFDMKIGAFSRLATLYKPIMDNIYCDFHVFFVPNRLVWEHWKNFCGERYDPDDTIDYTVPILTSVYNSTDRVTFGSQSIYDYMGLPVYTNNVKFNVLPFRAYNKIWNEFYRDENLQDRAPEVIADRGDTLADYKLLPRGKRADYFTSCLPWPQKGGDVLLPLGATAPVVSNGQLVRFSGYQNPGDLINRTVQIDANTNQLRIFGSETGATQKVIFGNESGLEADLSEATSATINEIREAFQIQRFLERDARGGTRYIELLKSHFGVTSSDARMQIPEYLGGSTSIVGVNTITQLSGNDLGDLGANGVNFNTCNVFKSFEEHGILMILMSFRAEQTYQQGLERKWSRKTRYDYYWPVFSHLGEQPILNKEIYCQGNAEDDEVFGYNRRYAEYLFEPNTITGKFRSTSVDAEGNRDTLDVYHLAQNFENLPRLNDEFIKSDAPFERVVKTPKEPKFLVKIAIVNNAVRPIPINANPGLVDHL